jgi:hypothetical protein
MFATLSLSSSNMASSPPASPSKTSFAEEPLLPTYEQFQSTDAATFEVPPDPTATADEIRDFVVHLLTAKRGLALDHARRIAAKWTIGNGKELRSYPPSMFLDIFGREDGWVVYKEVKLCIMQDERSKKPNITLASKCEYSPRIHQNIAGRIAHARLTPLQGSF